MTASTGCPVIPDAGEAAFLASPPRPFLFFLRGCNLFPEFFGKIEEAGNEISGREAHFLAAYAAVIAGHFRRVFGHGNVPVPHRITSTG
jgi:hypothetical protein